MKASGATSALLGRGLAVKRIKDDVETVEKLFDDDSEDSEVEAVTEAEPKSDAVEDEPEDEDAVDDKNEDDAADDKKDDEDDDETWSADFDVSTCRYLQEHKL